MLWANREYWLATHVAGHVKRMSIYVLTGPCGPLNVHSFPTLIVSRNVIHIRGRIIFSEVLLLFISGRGTEFTLYILCGWSEVGGRSPLVDYSDLSVYRQDKWRLKWRWRCWWSASLVFIVCGWVKGMEREKMKWIRLLWEGDGASNPFKIIKFNPREQRTSSTVFDFSFFSDWGLRMTVGIEIQGGCPHFVSLIRPGEGDNIVSEFIVIIIIVQ